METQNGPHPKSVLGRMQSYAREYGLRMNSEPKADPLISSIMRQHAERINSGEITPQWYKDGVLHTTSSTKNFNEMGTDERKGEKNQCLTSK